MSFSQLMAVLLGRWKAVLVTTLLFGLVALAVSLLLPKKYMASAAVLVDTRGGDPLGSPATERSQAANQAVMATQVDLLTSERVARRVVAQLKLEADPDLRYQWLRETGGKGDAASHIARALLKKLDVRPSRDSNVINLSYTGRDAGLAADVVNAFAQGSIDTNLELKVEPARQFAGWFDDRIKTLRAALEAAQLRLTAYQQDKRLIPGAAGQIDIETAKLAQLSSQLLEIQAARSDTNSRQSQARGDARTSPDVLANGTITSLRNSITGAETALKQLTTQLGDQHPHVVSAREQLDTLNARLDSESRLVARSVTTSNSVNQQRENETRAALEAQKARVLELLNGSNDAAVLQRDVESAQRALETAMTRQSQSALESQVRQTNVYLLVPAVEPALHSSPFVLLNVISALCLGLLVGLAAALWSESRRPLIRSAEDLSVVTDLPLLVSLSRDTGRRRSPAALRLDARMTLS